MILPKEDVLRFLVVYSPLLDSYEVTPNNDAASGYSVTFRAPAAGVTGCTTFDFPTPVELVVAVDRGGTPNVGTAKPVGSVAAA